MIPKGEHVFIFVTILLPFLLPFYYHFVHLGYSYYEDSFAKFDTSNKTVGNSGNDSTCSRMVTFVFLVDFNLIIKSS